MPTLNSIDKKKLKKIQKIIFKPKTYVLNFGCGPSTGSGKKLWNINSIESLNIINYDILLQDEVTVVGDAHSLPFKSNVIDSIICQAVLEHVKNPNKVVDEMLRVLKPGGYIYSEVPFMQGFHADPDDYQRYTLPGLKFYSKNLIF